MSKIFLALPLVIALLSLSSAASLAPRIVGGEPVPANSPVARQTVLLKGKILRASFTCTAVILDQDMLITAAHCLGSGGWADLTAHFGLQQDDGGEEIAVIGRRSYRPSLPYGQEGRWDDVAVLRLAKKLPAGYEPARLFASERAVRAGDQVLLAGYGRTEPYPPSSGDGGSGVLRQVEQNILEPVINETEMLVDIRGRGACNGDSGGPAFLIDGSGISLLGVASRLTAKDKLPRDKFPPDRGGGDKYGCIVDMIYTQVQPYREWLASAMQSLRSE